jgi:PAS domain S-box-containing protein
MPLRLLISGIAAALLLAATVAMGLYLGLETRDRFQQIDKNWKIYTNEADRRGELLSRIRGHMGYGGIIHNFKNYVLRQDTSYLERVTVQFADFKDIVKEYRQTDPEAEELAFLQTVEKTINEYESKLPHAILAAKNNWPIAKTDKLVKVDDTEAIKALKALDNFLRARRTHSTAEITSSVTEGEELVDTGFRYLLGLLVISLLLYALFYILQKELRQTVGLLSNELAERKTAEHVVKKFQRAVEQGPATIVITDTDGIIEYVNRKFTELSGYQPDEIIGKTPRILQSGETSLDTYLDLRRRIALGEEWRGIFKNRKKDEGYYWVQTAIFPLRDENGLITHYIGIGEDIAERQEAREQIKRAQKMEAVGLLASGVAHDFNNLLTTVLGNIHLARMEISASSEIDEELAHIEIAAKRARNLVGQILTFARRQSGEPIQLRISEAINEVCQLMRASIPRNISLECSVADESLSVLADPTRLHQVIVNLCSNAAEAIGSDSGTIRIRAEKIATDDNQQGWIKLIISDTGAGIPESYRQQIFEPFFTTKPAGKGTGLGLSIVANLVGEMKGKISLNSGPDVGTRFEIDLPQSKTANPVAKLHEHDGHGNERILVVDDDEDVVATIRKLLEQHGYRTDTFTDPLAAAAAFNADPTGYDMVMTDFVMPGMNGAELSQKIRAKRPDCPIIICTGYQPGTLDNELLAPFKLIEKPVDPVLLVRNVRSMFGPGQG